MKRKLFLPAIGVAAMDLTISNGKPQIWIATPTGVQVSRDMGKSFTDIPPREGQE
ncbi:hypothetical protein [Arthrobacter sp.]|uniref:hypothetical protein n=1 Tax=Arthrobacter sp. TaxID=1667 RepID=UPI003A8F7F2C